MPELLPGLIILIPFLAAAFIRFPRLYEYRVLLDCISIAAAACMTVAAGIACYYSTEAPIVHWVGGWEPQEGVVVGISLIADTVSAGFIFLTSLLTTAALLFMYKRYETTGSFMHILTLVFVGSFAGFILAGDLITMFVFLELMGICSYILTAFKVEDEAPIQAGFNIAVIATVGAFIFLLGVTLIYGLTDTPNIAEAAHRLSEAPSTPAIAVALALMISGLAIKSSLFPFHFAHADSHSVAPAPHAGLFGAILMQAGLYGIARLGSILLDAPIINMEAFQQLLITAGVLTALVGAFMSIAQNHLKRLLAFSSVAHIGIAAIGVGILNTEGLAGAGLYITGHAAMKMSLFLAAGVFLHRFSSVHAGKLAGLGKKASVLPWILITGALALAGVPPSGLYGGKVLIELGLNEIGLGWLIYLIYLSAALTGAAVIRFAIRIMRDKEPDMKEEPVYVHEKSLETNKKGGIIYMTSIPAALLAAGICITLFPVLTSGIERAVASDFDSSQYVELILQGERETAGEITAREFWSLGDLTKGIASALFAVIAGGILSIRRFDPSRVTAGPLELLRNLHSGHVGDYLAWLTFGAALIATWFVWQL